MRKRYVLTLALLFGVMLPALACSNPTAPRLPDHEDEDEDDEPDDNDDTAFLLRFSSQPVVV